ncbi:MAG: hypothetical protein IPH45_13135 [Bacteroidales bacterium]|nr:hypothetical protein [Bacteroidales bacterium]
MYNMSWYIFLTLLSLTLCLGSCLFHIGKLVSMGKPADHSDPIGNEKEGILYSFTGGMSPSKKESAFLHLPTYIAGLLYHIGTFLSFGLLLLILAGISLPAIVKLILGGFLILTASCGLGIFVKRFIKPHLRQLSNPDDYISNLLVTAFQVVTAIQLHIPIIAYFMISSALLLYLPLGKLKHMVYFFAARYQLGFFYGRRGVWPPKN